MHHSGPSTSAAGSPRQQQQQAQVLEQPPARVLSAGDKSMSWGDWASAQAGGRAWARSCLPVMSGQKSAAEAWALRRWRRWWAAEGE